MLLVRIDTYHCGIIANLSLGGCFFPTDHDLPLGEKCQVDIAFGDGLNDLEMLKFSGHRVVMSNAQAELKRKLKDYRITHSNCEDGVARYLTANL